MLQYPLWKKLLVGLVCLWGLLVSLPQFVPSLHHILPQNGTSWLPGRAVNLGLDLQGGVHLLLELQMQAVYQQRLDNLQVNLRQAFRKNRIRAHSYQFLPDSQGMRFTTNDTPDFATINELIRNASDDFVLSPFENGDSGRRWTVRFKEEAYAQMQELALSQSVEVVRRRIDEYGTSEPLIQRQGLDRILVQVPGAGDSASLKALLNTTARLTFHIAERGLSASERGSISPSANQIILPDIGDPNYYWLLEKNAIVGGEDLENAQGTFQESQAVVSFTFNASGAQAFGTATANHVGDILAIVLDDKVISAPRVNEPILGGAGVISGNFTLQSAEDLSILLRAGALPVPLTYIEERSVGPGLGADSIAAGKLASIIGFILVALFILLIYGRFGLFAVIALCLNLSLIVALIIALQITLTLPGIAGLVLTIGMAVDANVLIFERIREENRSRAKPSQAVESGYRIAFATIIDSNLTTLIGAILLFSFGSGPLKGFALTLSLGILCSMFTAIMVTRLLVIGWLQRTRPKDLNTAFAYGLRLR